MPISAVPLAKKTIAVKDRTMAYAEIGTGDPIVFLHGNPTSSYLWRKVMPHLVELGRCLAPDLIGMGDSDKLDEEGAGAYRFVQHREYLDAWLEAVGVTENVVFVVHDWGGVLGFDWANRHRGAVQGLAYMETIVCPVTWDDWPADAKGIFQGFRAESGERLILEKNLFVEGVLPNAVLRDLTAAEMAEYRRPFLDGGETRRPMLTWPREIPIEGTPEDVTQIVSDYGAWLAASELPKLFINADPGSILVGRQREVCRSWPNQVEITVPGKHFMQEDSPDEIGHATAGFVRKLRA
jgi:haloalkane dehalogenase